MPQHRSRSVDKRRSTSSKPSRNKSTTRGNAKSNSRRPMLARGVSTRTNQTNYSKYSSYSAAQRSAKNNYGRNVRLGNKGKIIARNRNGGIRTIDKNNKANKQRKTVRFSLNHDRRGASNKHQRSSSRSNRKLGKRLSKYSSGSSSGSSSSSGSDSTSLRSSRRDNKKHAKHSSSSSTSSRNHKHSRRYEGKNHLKYSKGHSHSRNQMHKAHKNALAIQCYWRQSKARERIIAREAEQCLQFQWRPLGVVAYDTERIDEVKRVPAFHVKARGSKGSNKNSSRSSSRHSSSSKHSSKITSKATLKAASSAVSEKRTLRFNSDLLTIVTALPGTVGKVLEAIGLNKYRKDFIVERIYTAHAAAKLSSRDLEKVGIKRQEHREKVRHALKKADERAKDEAHRNRNKSKRAVARMPDPEQLAIKENSWVCKGCQRLCGGHIQGSPPDRCRTCGLHKPGTSSRKDKQPSSIVWSCEMCSSSHWGDSGKHECVVCENKRPKVPASAKYSSIAAAGVAVISARKRFAAYPNATVVTKCACTLCGTKNSHTVERCQCCRRMLQAKDFVVKPGSRMDIPKLKEDNLWRCNICDKLNSTSKRNCGVCTRVRFSKAFVRGQNRRESAAPRATSRLVGGLRAFTRFGMHSSGQPPVAPPRNRAGQGQENIRRSNNNNNKNYGRSGSVSPERRRPQQHHPNRKLAASASYGNQHTRYGNQPRNRESTTSKGLLKSKTWGWLMGGGTTGGNVKQTQQTHQRRGRARSR